MKQKMRDTENILSEGLQQLPYPAYRLNEERKFVSRNKAANPRILPIRLRSSIDRYLTCADRKRMEELQVGEELPVDLQYCGIHGAIVYRCTGGYWIAMRDLITHLLTCVQQSGEEMPPFFTAIQQQIRDLHENQTYTPKELHILRDNYQHMLRYHTEMSLYLRYSSDKQEEGSVCEITSPLNALLVRIEQILHPNGFRPDIQLTEKTVHVCGEANVIRYAAALMIACAAEHLRDRQHFSIYSRVQEGEYLFSVLFEPLPEGELYHTILSGKYEEGLSSAFGTLFFQLLLLRRLACANGWRFTVVNAGNRDGYLRMTLAFPVEDCPPLLLNEASDPLPLVKVLLSFLTPSDE